MSRALASWAMTLIVALSIWGCAAFGSGPDAQFAQKNYHAALRAANEELEHEQALELERRREVHFLALYSLAKLGTFTHEADELDADMLRHWKALVQLLPAGSPKLANLQWAVGSYYLATYRLRDAESYLGNARQLAEATQNNEMTLRALHELSKAQLYRGEMKGSEALLRVALTLGARAAAIPANLEESGFLDAYAWLLDYEMQRAYRDPNSSPTRFDEAWTKLRALLDRMWGLSEQLSITPTSREAGLMKRSLLNLRAATLLAQRSHAKPGKFQTPAEAAERARSDEAWSRHLYELVNFDLDMGGSISRDPLMNRIICTKAHIESAFGQLSNSARSAEKCLSGSGADRDREFIVQEQLPALAAIYERAGELSRAAGLYEEDISRYEHLRNSIPVEDRESFYRGPARVPWAGLVRVWSRQYARRPSPANLEALLVSLDGMRARQLYELVTKTQPPVPNLATVRRKLEADSALLVTAMAESELVSLLVTRAAVQVVTVPVGEDELITELNNGIRRASLESSAAALQPALKKLSHWLIEPFERALTGINRITIVGDGELGAFPFELLQTQQGALGDRAAVAFSPSIAFYLRENAPTAPLGLYAFLHPEFRSKSTLAANSNGSTYEEEHTAKTPEERLTELFPKHRQLLIPEQYVTKSTFKRLRAGTFSHLHIGAHGRVGDNNEPAIQLVDGTLSSSDVSKLRLDNTLTVLAVCESEAGEKFPGEGVMGLGRAFLLARSSGVIVTLWPVESKATAAFMNFFYRYNVAGIDAARALAMAKRRVATQRAYSFPANAPTIVTKESQLERNDWSAPRYWGAFVLLANGGLLHDTGGASVPAGTFSDDFTIPSPFDE